MKYAIILDNKIQYKYEDNEKQSFGGAWGSEEAKHIEIPEAIKLEHAQWDGEKIVEVLPPPLSIKEQRKAKYLEKGITVEAMIIALWEKQVENRSEAVDALQAERVKIKQEIPKV